MSSVRTQVISLLEGLQRSLERVRVLTAAGQGALEYAVRQLKEHPNLPPDRKKHGWFYSVGSALPLRFERCLTDSGCDADVDIMCRVGGADKAAGCPLTEQSVVVRLWVAGPGLFSEAQRASGMCAIPWQCSPHAKHVISRYRFDRAESKGEPVYHLQIGGTYQEGEDCWHPRKLEVPRLPQFPMDLVLACESVLANFLPEAYARLSVKAEWQWVVTRAEKLFVEPFLEELHGRVCVRRRPRTLLQTFHDMNPTQ